MAISRINSTKSTYGGRLASRCLNTTIADDPSWNIRYSVYQSWRRNRSMTGLSRAGIAFEGEIQANVLPPRVVR